MVRCLQTPPGCLVSIRSTHKYSKSTQKYTNVLRGTQQGTQDVLKMWYSLGFLFRWRNTWHLSRNQNEAAMMMSLPIEIRSLPVSCWWCHFWRLFTSTPPKQLERGKSNKIHSNHNDILHLIEGLVSEPTGKMAENDQMLGARVDYGRVWSLWGYG